MKQMGRKLRISRPALTRKALCEALERQHRKGYKARPVRKAEFGVWEREQKWGDE